MRQPIGRKAMQYRQRKRRGLASASLRDADDILPIHSDRQCLILDRGWNDVFLIRKRAGDRFGEAEIMKRTQEVYLSI